MNKLSEQQVVFPLHPWSVVLAVVADWSLFAANLVTHLRVLPWLVLLSACVVGIVTAVIERRLGGASWRMAAIKAVALAVLVAAPLPLLGTFLGGLALLWAIVLAADRAKSARTEHHKLQRPKAHGARNARA